MHKPLGIGQAAPIEGHQSIARKSSWQVWTMAIGAAAIASAIPAANLPVGSTAIVVLPITYAFVLALILNIALRRHIGPATADGLAHRFGTLVSASMLPFVVMLGAAVAQNWGIIVDAGPALVLQEIGHFGGTVLLSFPIAVWILRLGRETIGATFSIAREPSVAIIAERYGLGSPEGTGVLAIYIIGTLAGTLFFSILASLAAGTGLFDYRALAVACGIGSGGMTAACAGALGLADPHHKEEILALAGASNLLSGIGGFYITLFVSLPLVDYLYRKFGSRNEDTASPGDTPRSEEAFTPTPGAWDWAALCFASIAIPAIASNDVKLAVMIACTTLAISALSILVSQRVSRRLPAIAWASLFGIALGALPVTRSLVASAMDGFDPISMVLLPLAIAGFALGSREARAARQVGWKLVIVSMAIFLGTFGGAVLIAQATLGVH
jgi:hypothetical protein